MLLAKMAERYWDEAAARQAGTGSTRVRNHHHERARPDARSRQRQRAAAQFRRLARPLRALRALGFLPTESHGNGAHQRYSGIRYGSACRPTRPTSNRCRARVSKSFSPRCFRHNYFHADMHPGNIFRRHRASRRSEVHRRRFRHHGFAIDQRSALSGGKLRRFFQSRLSACCRVARRFRLGRQRHAYRRVRGRHSQRLRTDVPAPAGTRFPSASCCYACFRPRVPSTWKSSRSCCCCRKPCCTSRVSGASCIRNSTCGIPPSPSSSAGYRSSSACAHWSRG